VQVGLRGCGPDERAPEIDEHGSLGGAEDRFGAEPWPRDAGRMRCFESAQHIAAQAYGLLGPERRAPEARRQRLTIRTLDGDAGHAAQHFGAVHTGDVRMVDAREQPRPLQERPRALVRRRVWPEGHELDRPVEAQVPGQHPHGILAGRADDLLQAVIAPERAAQPLEPVRVGHGGQLASEARSESSRQASPGRRRERCSTA
jgi:hypothetical protein